jgi:hypothetical protein
MENKFIKPKENKTVYDPIAKSNIAMSGQMVIMNSYWQRLFLDGDIDVIDTEPEITENLKRGKK